MQSRESLYRQAARKAVASKIEARLIRVLYKGSKYWRAKQERAAEWLVSVARLQRSGTMGGGDVLA